MEIKELSPNDDDVGIKRLQKNLEDIGQSLEW